MLEVRYEWSFPSWAVRIKPTAKGIPHSSRSYLDPNSSSLQKPIEGLPIFAFFSVNRMWKNTAAGFYAV